MKWQQKVSWERLTHLSATSEYRMMWNFNFSFYYSCHLARHPAHVLSCAYSWKISADKHILFIYSVNLILLVDFNIPDFSWHMTEKFSNNGEVALGFSSNHSAMKNKALFSFAPTVTKRLQEKSFFKIMSCLVLRCSVEVLIPTWEQTTFPSGQKGPIPTTSIYKNKTHLAVFAMLF